MFRSAVYSDIADLQSVDVIGWIDVGEAIKNGFVPGNIDDTTLEYNDIDDPSSVMNYATDVFEVYRQGDYIKGFKPSKAEPTEQTE